MPLTSNQLNLLIKRAKNEADRLGYGDDDSIVRLVIGDFGKHFYISREQVINALKSNKNK